MPYISERANPQGHVAVLQDDHVLTRLGTFRRTSLQEERELFNPQWIRTREELTPTSHSITHNLAIDGSIDTVSLNNPKVEAGFIKVGVVLENMRKLKLLEGERLVDRRVLDDCYRSYSCQTVIPGPGITDLGGTLSSRDKYRMEVYESLKHLRVDPENLFKKTGEAPTLLEVLVSLRGRPREMVECTSCRVKVEALAEAPRRCGACGESMVYYSDFLGLHDRIRSEGSTNFSYTEVMSTFERLIMAGLLLKAGQTPESLMKVAFITDGPLAFFLSGSLAEDMLTLYQSLPACVLFGVEKTGTFVDFASQSMLKEVLPPGSVFMVNDEALKRVTGKARKEYGQNSFYGRRFIYRSDAGAFFVFTTPPAYGTPYGEGSDYWEAYPTLRVICEVLEADATYAFGVETPALSVVAQANHAASLPKGLGEELLTSLLGTVPLLD